MGRTVPIEARIDICALAEVDRYYRGLNDPPRSRSDLVYRIVQDFYALLVQNGHAEYAESVNEAYVYLEGVFQSVGKPGRNVRSLNATRRAETMADEGFDPNTIRAVKSTEESVQEATILAVYKIRKKEVEDSGQQFISLREFKEEQKAKLNGVDRTAYKDPDGDVYLAGAYEKIRAIREESGQPSISYEEWLANRAARANNIESQ